MQPNVGRNFPPRPRGLPPVSQHHPPGHVAPQRQQVEEQQRQQHLRRLAQYPTDREIPDGVDDMVVGDVVQRYKALRDVERKLDAVLINKRLAAKDSGQRHERRLRTMRVWISATSTDKDNSDTRMEDTFDFNDDTGSGNYKLRIEGRLLPDDDDDEDEDQDVTKPAESTTMDLDKPSSTDTTANPTKQKAYFERHKFSHYLRTITFTFNPSAHAPPNVPTPAPIQWKKPSPTQNGAHPTGADANFDALEFERKLEEGVHSVIITMERADPHGRIRGKLSPALSKILDKEYEDPSGAMMGLYNYVRLKGLEQEGNPQYFRCDDALKAVFGTDTLSFPYAPEEISKNIQPLPDITLPFTIRLSNPPAPPTIYDIPILVDDPLEEFTSYFRSATNPRMDQSFSRRLENIAQLDKDIALAVQGIYASKAKASFLTQLADEPVGFIKKWMSSQQADEEVILAEERSRGPEWSRSGADGVWNTQGAKESVVLMLARPTRTS